MKKRGMKIYFIHSDKIDYNNIIYLPVLRSNYLSNHTLVFSDSEENKNKYYKELINNADLIVVELTNPDIGFNMQVKEAVVEHKPILGLASNSVGYDAKYNKLINNIKSYGTEEEFRTLVENFAKEYDGKIINGKVDNTLVLGMLN